MLTLLELKEIFNSLDCIRTFLKSPTLFWFEAEINFILRELMIFEDLSTTEALAYFVLRIVL